MKKSWLFLFGILVIFSFIFSLSFSQAINVNSKIISFNAQYNYESSSQEQGPMGGCGCTQYDSDNNCIDWSCGGSDGNPAESHSSSGSVSLTSKDSKISGSINFNSKSHKYTSERFPGPFQDSDDTYTTICSSNSCTTVKSDGSSSKEIIQLINTLPFSKDSKDNLVWYLPSFPDYFPQFISVKSDTIDCNDDTVSVKFDVKYSYSGNDGSFEQSEYSGTIVYNRTVKLINSKIYLDPEYLEQMKGSSGFSPKRITPFSNIICEVKIDDPFADSCGDLGSVDIKGKLLTSGVNYNDPNYWNVVIKEDDFENADQGYDDNGHSTSNGVYHWKIKGWSADNTPVGWNTNEDVIKALYVSKEIKCFAYINNKPEINASIVTNIPGPTPPGEDDEKVFFSFKKLLPLGLINNPVSRCAVGACSLLLKPLYNLYTLKESDSNVLSPDDKLFQSYLSANPDFNNFYNLASKFENEYYRMYNEWPTTSGFFGAWMLDTKTGRGYGVINKNVPYYSAFLHFGGIDSDPTKRQRYSSIFASVFSGQNNLLFKTMNFGGVKYNMDHTVLGIMAYNNFASSFVQSWFDTNDDYLNYIDSKAFDISGRLNPQNYNGNMLGEFLNPYSSQEKILAMKPTDYLRKVFFPIESTVSQSWLRRSAIKSVDPNYILHYFLNP